MTVTTETPLDGLAKLRAEVPAHLIAKLPRVTCRDCSSNKGACSSHRKTQCPACKSYISEKHIHLDYVGHAETTSILLDADPGWFWEPMALGEDGLPKFDETKGLWIRLTVCGVTRIGYGTAENAFGNKARGDLVKEVIGDAIRNAAMRFGVALDLWAKSDLHRDEHDETQAQTQVAEAVERKAKRERRSTPPAEDEFAAAAQDKPPANLLRNMNIALKERGFTADEARYAEVSRLVGRPITSTSQLSADEARHVLRSLAGTPGNPAPNPANGDRPVPAVTAAALWAPTLDTLVTRAETEGGKPVVDQLRDLIGDAPTPEHINRVGQLAAEARDADHISPKDFGGLAAVVKARREALGLVGDEAPTAEQYEARDALEKRVRSAYKPDAFTDVYGAMVDAEAAGNITKVQCAALTRMLDARYEGVKARWSEQQRAEAGRSSGWSHSHPVTRGLAEMAGTGATA